MTPELRAAVDELPDDVREHVRAILEEEERAKAAGYLEDMGYDECPVCLANRRREAMS